MRRSARRYSDDYLENEELNGTEETYEEFDYEAEDVVDEAGLDTEEMPEKKSAWIKIGKVALIILVLIALFFISMKVTEIFLDRNQEPDYGAEAPAYTDSDLTDDEDIPVIDEEPDDEVKTEEKDEEIKEYKEDTETDKKPTASQEKPSVPEEPKEPEKPKEPEQPSTPEAPSKPSKPVITPGNPAA